MKGKDVLPTILETVSMASSAATMAIDNIGSVTVSELIDTGNYSRVFAIMHKNGILREIKPGARVPRSARIVYIGNDRGWSEAPETDLETGTVTFRTSSDYHSIEYRVTFSGILGDTLLGVLDGGRPMIYFDTENDVTVQVECDEKMNDLGIERYHYRGFNWFAGRNDDYFLYYSDDYFLPPARERNPKLMMLALNLEIAASTEADSGNKRPDSIKSLLKRMGCQDIYVNEVYETVPNIRSTDVIVGSKRWKDYNLIFLVPNGAHYSVEFAANVMIGENGEHTGFALSRDESLKALREHIGRYKITGKTKILVAGYSRTAAGSNLVGKYISDAIAEGAVKERFGDIELEQDDVYVYCFETPLCGYHEKGEGTIPPDDPRYDNIWYFTNPDDPVTYVPTEKYGFVRYGNHILLNPDHDPDINKRMLANIEALYGKNAVPFYDMTDFIPVSDLQYMEDVNKNFVKKFFDALGTREFYYQEVEDDFVRTIYLGSTKTQVLRDIVKELGGIKGCISTLHTYTRDKEEFVRMLKPSVERSTEKYNCGEYSDNLVNSAYQIMNLIERYCEGSIIRFLTDKRLQAMLLNVNRVIKCHYPEMSLAYLMIDDPDYPIPYIHTAEEAPVELEEDPEGLL